MNSPLNTASLKKSISRFLHFLNVYKGLVFFLLLTSLYGYIVWRINVLSSAPPTSVDVANAQDSIEVPKIPQATVIKIEGLKDNSVRVQALFNQARDNPFQE